MSLNVKCIVMYVECWFGVSLVGIQMKWTSGFFKNMTNKPADGKFKLKALDSSSFLEVFRTCDSSKLL